MKKLILWLTIFCTFSIVGCISPKFVYAPSAANVPVITEKGESKLGAVYSSHNTNLRREKARGVDVQGAYALSNNLAIQAAYMYRGERRDNSAESTTFFDKLKYERNLTELGLGYYTAINNEKNLYAQVFAGGGIGKFKFTDAGSEILGDVRFHNADISKVYLQPAMLYFPAKKFSISGALRFSNIKYKNIQTNYTASELVDNNLKDLNNKNLLFWEPALGFNYRITSLPALSLEMQFGTVVLLSSNTVPYAYRTGVFSIGANVDFSKLGRTEKK